MLEGFLLPTLWGHAFSCSLCFVEFADEYGAKAALSLGGMMLGYYPVRVLPSKTVILPVNPSYLPWSEDEREMCARTVYCTNIDKMVTRLSLLGDQLHSTHIAFVEFSVSQAESAIAALTCCGMVLGAQPIRVSPSKMLVRARVSLPLELVRHLYWKFHHPLHGVNFR